jgi:hypothetical protein
MKAELMTAAMNAAMARQAVAEGPDSSPQKFKSMRTSTALRTESSNKGA